MNQAFREVRRYILVIIAFAALSACSDAGSKFAGIWCNSPAGDKGIWLYISKVGDSYLVREAVGQPDNFGPSGSAKVVDSMLVVGGNSVIYELAFIDKSENILVTVDGPTSEIRFYRQPQS